MATLISCRPSCLQRCRDRIIATAVLLEHESMQLYEGLKCSRIFNCKDFFLSKKENCCESYNAIYSQHPLKAENESIKFGLLFYFWGHTKVKLIKSVYNGSSINVQFPENSNASPEPCSSQKGWIAEMTTATIHGYTSRNVEFTFAGFSVLIISCYHGSIY